MGGGGEYECGEEKPLNEEKTCSTGIPVLQVEGLE
jgi:hypothetical protein